MTTSPVTFSDRESAMTTPLPATIALAGRILLTLPFLRSGLSKIIDFETTAGFMRAEGMPFVRFLLIGAIVLEVAGGLSVAAGYRARLGAVALIVFLIPTTLIFHDFWTFTGQAMELQKGFFFTNLALLGGLSLVAAFGSGLISVDTKV